MLSTVFRAIAVLGIMTGTAAAFEASAGYVVSVGGINVATVGVTLEADASSYDLKLKADVAGLGNLVASGTAAIDSVGAVSQRGLAPANFSVTTRANGASFSSKVGYTAGNVSSFIVDPPIIDNYGRIPIERSHLVGVGDMLASFVFSNGKLDSSLCKRTLSIFTGVERFNIAMSFVGMDEATSTRTAYQGPVVLCNMKYKPISGHYEYSEMTSFLASSDRILIWYAPLGSTGYFIPYRMLMNTSAGDLSMVLTRTQAP